LGGDGPFATLFIHGDLRQQALPDLLVPAETLLQILQNPLEIRIVLQVIPGWNLLKPGIILIAQIDSLPQPAQRHG
jgi:hypothetical protein